MRKRNNIMLAHPAENKRIENLGKFFFTQPKLNGVRCYVKYQNGQPVLFSSTGLEKQFLDHILWDLKKLPPFEYDGELYTHGKPWEWINSIASRTKNPHPEVEQLQFHIFDIKNNKPQKERLSKLLKIYKYLPSIKFTPYRHSNAETWYKWLNLYTKQGYEGIIFRSRNGLYALKRSPNLLKYKPTETDIYKIIRLIQGTGWCYDRLGAFEVEDKHGNLFCVGSGDCLTATNRLSYWQNAEQYVGKYLLVKHELLKTKNNFPQCAIAVIPLTDTEADNFRIKNHNDLI